MLEALDGTDERDTVRGTSEDSVSTVSVCSFAEGQEPTDVVNVSDADKGGTVHARPCPRTFTALSDCQLMHSSAHPSAHVNPIFVTTPPGSRDNEPSKPPLSNSITLRLRWHLYTPFAKKAQGKTYAASNTTCLPREDGVAHRSAQCVDFPDLSGSPDSLWTAPTYATYNVAVDSNTNVDISTEAGQRHRVALSLPIGRRLFRESTQHPQSQQMTDKTPSGSVDHDENLLDEVKEHVIRTLSRHHATVTLYFKTVYMNSSGSLVSLPTGEANSLAETSPSFTFQSMDVTDAVSSTFINGVPLTRHHRYHFTTGAATPFGHLSTTHSHGASSLHFVALIGLGPHAALELHHVCGPWSVTDDVSLRAKHWGSGANVDTGLHSDDLDGDGAILVPSKSTRSSSSRASLQTSLQPSAPLGSTGAAPRRANVLQATLATSRQTVALPHSAETIVSSTTTALGTASASLNPIPHGHTVEGGEEPVLAAALPLSLVGSSTYGSVVSPPDCQHPLQPEAHSHPLPRKGTAAKRAPPGGPSATGRPCSRASKEGNPPLRNPTTTSLPLTDAALADRTNQEDPNSSSLSTPSSMRNSTWTETFVDTLADTPEESPLGRRPLATRDTRTVADSPGVPRVTTHPPGHRVIFTTGIRLDDKDEKALRKMGVVVNPDLKKAHLADVLVVQRPLVRSVKLLTVLPFVEAVAQRQWLDEVLSTQDPTISAQLYPYSERRTASSIEGENNFSLAELLKVPPLRRQRLFSPHMFWVHAAAKPQEPPSNDLKTVITASGGRITRTAKQATVFVLGGKKVSKTVLNAVAKEARLTVDALLASERLLVYPDDIFRAVLQQTPLEESCVEWGNTQSSATTSSQSRRPSGRRSALPSTVTIRRPLKDRGESSQEHTTAGKRRPRKSTRSSATASRTKSPRQSTVVVGRNVLQIDDSASSPPRRSARKK